MRRIAVIILSMFLLLACSFQPLAERRTATAAAQTVEERAMRNTDVAATKTHAPTPTQTATFTATVTHTPTVTPTRTLRPSATLSPTLVVPAFVADVEITAQDLPDNYVAFELEDMDLSVDDLQSMLGPDFQELQKVYSFIDDRNFQIIVGWTIYLPTILDRANMDVWLNHSENTLDELTALFGPETGITDIGLFEQQDIGDASMGVHLKRDISGLSTDMQIDMVVVRRGVIGIYVSKYYLVGEGAAPDIFELARILDARAVEAIPE